MRAFLAPVSLHFRPIKIAVEDGLKPSFRTHPVKDVPVLLAMATPQKPPFKLMKKPSGAYSLRAALNLECPFGPC
jgi:hypothetical protein